jgi:hypothetical protein
MGNAIANLIEYLEYSIQKTEDPEEREELLRTLITARKVAQHRRNLCCA